MGLIEYQRPEVYGESLSVQKGSYSLMGEAGNGKRSY